MKKFTQIICLAMVAISANAATFNYTGEVALLRSHDIGLGLNSDWIALKGFGSAGICGISDEGYVVLRIKDDDHGKRQFSLALSAFMSGKQVGVNVDDTLKDASGYCFLRYINLQ